MKASIVLPNLNGAGWFEGCIESLYAQTEQDFELIVVDNGSTDKSLETARSYKGKPGYTLVENTENTGFSAAVNTGIHLAKAPYVLLFNNDAFAKPDMLEKMLQAIQKDEKIFAVQCLMMRHFEPEKVDDAGDYINLLGWACKRGNGLPVKRYQKQMRIFSACGGAAMYRKEVFEKIGGYFDEAFFAYLEDVDVSWRANSQGYKNIYCPSAVCTHISGATTSGTSGENYNDFKSIQSGRNNLLLPYKNMPIVMLILNFPFLLLGYLIKTLFFNLRGFGKPWWQGTKEAFVSFKLMKKPKFKWKNLPNYFWIEGSMFIGCFRFLDYRIRRLFTK